MNKFLLIMTLMASLLLATGNPVLASGLWVEVDIKPQSCPNPINTNSKGVIPVAILGSADFDVTSIDVTTVTLENAAPLRSALEDVSTSGISGCTTLGSDGYLDLVLMFRSDELNLSCSTPQDIWISGYLLDGLPFAGSDEVIVICPPN
jgi:hypothetical protein